MPQQREDSVYVAMNAWLPTTDADTSELLERLSCSHGMARGWRVSAHPSQHFMILK